ncbi:MAG: cytochrome P450 [Propionibacteriales bacterium]|nr:cytochrome P450 [Propionibacteriales bacterium]
MRERGAVLWHERSRRWLVFAHAEANAALRDRRLGRIWSDKQPADRFAPFNLLHRNQMMENEPPAHTRLRRPVAQAFARGHVERLRPRVRALAGELLDRVDPAGFDVIREYAEPLPVLVIAELLGVPASDHTELRRWSQAIVRMYEETRSRKMEDAAVAAGAEFAGYIRDHARAKRRRPGDDLMSDLLRPDGGAGGGALTDDELVASVVLLLNAGHEASVNVFGNGFVALLENPEQLARLRADPGLASTAVEEMIRFDSALQLFERTATADLELGGRPLATGEMVAVLLGSANRDGRVFERPDVFDVGRDPNPHVGFGAGVHFCLGAPLARMELVESLARLVRRWPGLGLAAAPLRRPTLVLRGYESVRVAASTRPEGEAGRG